jgi:hypothetical protein
MRFRSERVVPVYSVVANTPSVIHVLNECSNFVLNGVDRFHNPFDTPTHHAGSFRPNWINRYHPPEPVVSQAQEFRAAGLIHERQPSRVPALFVESPPWFLVGFVPAIPDHLQFPVLQRTRLGQNLGPRSTPLAIPP